MRKLSRKQFESVVAKAIDSIPPLYRRYLDNVAFIIEDEPTSDQRQRLKLQDGESLFGLYEGTPLPARGGATKLLPDKITLFKRPLESISNNLEELKENVRHTIWHEVAHYYGLDHQRIRKLESKKPGAH